MTLLEGLIEKRLEEIGMPLSQPLLGEDLKAAAKIDDVVNLPYAPALLRFIFGISKGAEQLPTFLQERVEFEDVPEVMRLSRIKKGFGVEYGVSKGDEYIDVRFNKDYSERECFDLRFYMLNGADLLFRVGVSPEGKIGLNYLFEPINTAECVKFSGSETLQRYLNWSVELRAQMQKGMSPEQMADFVLRFLRNRVAGNQ